MPQFFLAPILLVAACATGGDDPPLERRFDQVVRPFLNAHCLSCHGTKKQEAKLDLSGETSIATVVKNPRVWETILERLEAEEMPPAKAPKQPTAADRSAVISWIREMRDREALQNAGDPGIVLARRLSNAEYDDTIRDLTGIDMRPTREFPVDPANEAGFDNSGESLTMSPALTKKYLEAARNVADHLVLKPDGFDFAPDLAITDSDRDKYCVSRIINFYNRHQVDYADYFMAAWKYKNRVALGRPDSSTRDVAQAAGISPRYLDLLWSALTEPRPETGPIDTIRAAWQKLPDGTAKTEDIRRDCERLRDLVIRLRKPLTSRVDRLHVKGISDGSQPLVLWKNRRGASLRMKSPEGRELDAFCRIFPDKFVESDRGLYSDSKSTNSGRPLTAGFHLMQGYFRDDEPLCELVLDEAERRELDGLWSDLNFVTMAPMRQYKDFIFFERAEPPRFMQPSEFDFARSEDKDAISEEKILKLKSAYVARAKTFGASEVAIEAIETYFTQISAEIRRVETAKKDAEPRQLEALVKFAERASRRPVTPSERDDLLTFYKSLREKDELSHDDAIRDSVASVLMSPQFLYRVDPAIHGKEASPISDYALASRLSYFLWSSMPDEELLAHAAAGDLHKPDVLVAQTRRMLRDIRVRGLATEFGGNWLDFRRFEEHNGVDRGRFASFTNELRHAMYEEPLHFFIDIASNDRSVLEFVEGTHTFVNPILAKHYGMPDTKGGPDTWVRIDDARRFGRGGILPMAAFLTKNSPGLRTSPVKRGYWVVRRVLGQEIPPPPPEVPELPKDEAASGDLTLPQLLERHRQNPACAGCHQKFDSVGLVFEGYGPVGERRDKDLGNRPISAKATFPDGREGEGLDDLRRYLSEKRKNEFVDNLCRKMLAYGLGRTLMLSDEATIKTMHGKLYTEGFRFGAMVETIVTSPQFLKKRGRDDDRTSSRAL